MDISLDGNLLNNEGIINSALDDPLLNGFDESFFSDLPLDGAEIALNNCASIFSPSRKIRKRENGERCSASGSDDSNPRLPSLDAGDLAQEAQKRKWCSHTGMSVTEFYLVCAYSGQRVDESYFLHVAGYLREFSAA